ncbi:RNA polymerase sigma factor [bacterium]|nr:RNA polymerase sigma factor [bacterium]
MDEAVAIRLCITHRDPVGFEFLVNKYRREALFHARSLLGNAEDAADACQECFTRAFIAMPRLDKMDAFYPWFYRILRNYCLNVLSRRKTATKYRVETQRAGGVNVDTATPLFLLEKTEEQKLVWETLEQLPPDSREILVMKYIQGLKYEEISQMLAIPRGTVMSRLYYARKAFHDKFTTNETSERSKGHVRL